MNGVNRFTPRARTTKNYLFDKKPLLKSSKKEDDCTNFYQNRTFYERVTPKSKFDRYTSPCFDILRNLLAPGGGTDRFQRLDISYEVGASAAMRVGVEWEEEDGLGSGGGEGVRGRFSVEISSFSLSFAASSIGSSDASVAPNTSSNSIEASESESEGGTTASGATLGTATAGGSSTTTFPALSWRFAEDSVVW